MKADLTTFYVYAHHRATDGAIFYIGKGTKGRAYKTHGRNVHWKRVVAKYGYYVTILADNLTESEALAREIELISEFGKFALCNMTDGGEGMSGYRHTVAGKAKIAKAHLGIPRPAEAIEKMRITKIGKTPSTETRRKMSEARKGYVHTSEAVQKMREKANARSAETIAKQVASNTGKIRSSEARAKMAAAQTGTPVSCSNGMLFEKKAYAVAWLRENGYPKASVSLISRACTEPHRIAYGFSWKTRANFY